jgi:hypothetical protein
VHFPKRLEAVALYKFLKLLTLNSTTIIDRLQVLAAQGLNPGQLNHAQAEARVLQYEAELKAAAGI